MRNFHFPKLFFCIAFHFLFVHAGAQDNWISYSKSVDAKNYEGKKFRLSAMVRTELFDDSASAHLWARVDKQKGTGFFENMDKSPIRSSAWKPYLIQGKIDTSARRLAFGIYCIYNGKFYFDNLKLEVETGKNKWQTLYTANFEDGSMDSLSHGIGMGKSGINNGYTATVVNDKTTNSKVLQVEGDTVPNFGVNSKVGKFANVNGIKLYYEIYGNGAPLVVLHGNGGSIKDASSFYPTLMKQYKVIAIDSRNQGNSTNSGATMTYDLMASDVNELLNQLNIDSAFVWGQSDGAILGLLLAKDYPKKVKRALVYSPNIQADSNALFQWAIDYSKKIIKDNKDAKDVMLNQMMLDYPNMPYSELSKIKAPILMMCGDRDVIRPEHILKMYQSIPNSQLCVLPGATHGGAWEKPDLFLMIMNDFFNKPFTMPDTKNWYE
ncbi:MAG: alpha/beta hydrolase [Ferruginibacter sp.]